MGVTNFDSVTADNFDVSGADVVAQGTRGTHVSNAKVDYATPDLDTEAELIVAFNTTNGKINAILTILEEFGLLANS